MPLLTAVVSLLTMLLGPGTDPECYALGGLDVARAEALANVDLTALRAVYASRAAAVTDERVLKRYAARGFRIVGGGMVREECRAVARAGRRVELDVTERLAPALAVDETGRIRRLPRDRFTRHRVVLVRGDDDWQIGYTVGVSVR
ncbi:MAG TPA: hypothetical protein VM093_07610 [Aeromicrobium sp.]|nr:hypothetical protein [Aeromicrobium sp.]